MSNHFFQRCQNEWKRLNPKFVGQDDNLRTTFVNAFHEGAFGFFAPVRFLWWSTATTAAITRAIFNQEGRRLIPVQ